MRLLNILTIFIISATCFAQDSNPEILLKAGSFIPNNEFILEDFSTNSPRIFDGKYYRFMQFSVLPSTKQKQNMENLGIHFLEYIPNNTFLVSISKNISKKKLESFRVNAIIPVKSEQKIHPKLQNGKTPDWAKDGDNAMLEVLLYKDVNLALAFEQLKANSFNVKEINTYAHVFIISTAISNLEKLANNPFIPLISKLLKK